jgi:hypothetical protein
VVLSVACHPTQTIIASGSMQPDNWCVRARARVWVGGWVREGGRASARGGGAPPPEGGRQSKRSRSGRGPASQPDCLADIPCAPRSVKIWKWG